MTEEQINKLKELAAKYDPNFNYEKEHWYWGNVDDSYLYGVESGENNILGAIFEILNNN